MSQAYGPHSAAASAAGYLYQCRYALLLALQRAERQPGIELSIEKFDDVAFEAGGEPLELIQTKHHFGRPRDLTDASADLWKTLRVWARAVLEDPSSLRRVERVLVTTSHAGGAAALLRPGDARCPERALMLLERVAQSSTNEENRLAYSAFLELEGPARLALLRSIFVLDASPDLLEAQARIADEVRHCVSKEHRGAFVERLEGWWWGRVCRALVDPRDASISIAEVEDALARFREAFQPRSLPVDLADAALPDEEAQALDERIFVRQLRLVGVGTKRLGRAKHDYYRAFEQRSRWAREKLIFDDEIASYDRRLREEWEIRFEAMVDRLAGCSDEPRLAEEGRVLLEWVEQDARYPLRSIVEPFLCVGSFHMLADRLRVGWHRDYALHLNGDGGKGSPGEGG